MRFSELRTSNREPEPVAIFKPGTPSDPLPIWEQCRLIIDELFIVLGYETLVDYVNLISYLNPTIALQQASYSFPLAGQT